MKVSVCILNWNQKSTIEQSISKIKYELKDYSHEILVYDQNSDDGSVECLQNHPMINHLWLSSCNTGNCISRNEMIKKAQGEYIFMLDSDIIPIENSIVSMLSFLDNYNQFMCVGYDCFCLSTTNPERCTPFESELKLSDVESESEHIFTQYGLFRSKILKSFPFPEFAPFDQPGWGAEDTIVCQTLLAYGHKVARIMGRIYWHKTHSSTFLLKDLYLPSRTKRRIVYKYFIALDKEKQLEALQKKVLPVTILNVKRYHIDESLNSQFKQPKNLGDRLFPWLLDQFFPFYQFSSHSENVLFFGGSVFEHTKNFNYVPKNILYYGCGLSKKDEIAIPKRAHARIFTRGPLTTKALISEGYNVIDTVGDPAMLLALMPKMILKTNGTPYWVVDAFFKSEACPSHCRPIAVAQTSYTQGIDSYHQPTCFFEALRTCSHLTSSQIHPFLMAITRGIPATLVPKDWRARDLFEFFEITAQCDLEQCIELRDRIFNDYIEPFIFQLIGELNNFKSSACHFNDSVKSTSLLKKNTQGAYI